MIQTLTLVETERVIPYANLALEEYLLHRLREGECILYLWQNRHTVVIGRNQNAWKECRCERLEADGGYVARRLSGGGAVYHDLGNLNFTFLAKAEDYDIARQTMVVLAAMRRLGIQGEKTGRNDILVEGRKVSGHAYYETQDGCYHHGTIMISVDKEKLRQYLHVDREKLQSNGVDSVVSRVGNLCDFADVSVASMKRSLREAFEAEYGLRCAAVRAEDIADAALEKLEEKYASWEWRYGRNIAFSHRFSHRFAWGSLQIHYNVRHGRLAEVDVYSDSLYPAVIDAVKASLPGTRFVSGEIRDCLARTAAACGTEIVMLSDIADALCDWIS